eukprot:COSAG02_NODE_300_length_25279_cov_159.676529_14_plen_138_part_00
MSTTIRWCVYDHSRSARSDSTTAFVFEILTIHVVYWDQFQVREQQLAAFKLYLDECAMAGVYVLLDSGIDPLAIAGFNGTHGTAWTELVSAEPGHQTDSSVAMLAMAVLLEPNYVHRLSSLGFGNRPACKRLQFKLM